MLYCDEYDKDCNKVTSRASDELILADQLTSVRIN